MTPKGVFQHPPKELGMDMGYFVIEFPASLFQYEKIKLNCGSEVPSVKSTGLTGQGERAPAGRRKGEFLCRMIQTSFMQPGEWWKKLWESSPGSRY
jgi:hypothetical protein